MSVHALGLELDPSLPTSSATLHHPSWFDACLHVLLMPASRVLRTALLHNATERDTNNYADFPVL